MNNQKMELELRDVLERVWRAKWKILLFQMAILLVTVFVILFWPRTYASVMNLYMKIGHESVSLDPTATTGQTIALQQAGRDAEIKSAIDVLVSRGTIGAVVDRLTPEVVLGHVAVGQAKTSPIADVIKGTIGMVVTQLRKIDPASDRERAIIQIEKNLTVEAERKSEVIAMTYEADTPQLAQMVAQAIADEFRSRHSHLHQITGSTEFFDAQSSRLRQELESTSDQLRDAKNRIGLASIEGERKNLEDRMNEVRSDLLVAQKSIASLEAKRGNLQAQVKARPKRRPTEEVSRPNAAADMQQQLLYTLQLQVMDAEARLTSDHPTVLALKDQVKEAQREQSLQKPERIEKSNNVDPIHEKLSLDLAEAEAELVALKAREESLKVQDQEIQDRMKTLNAVAIEIEQLQRDVLVSEKKYMSYAEHLEEARIDQALQQSKLSSVRFVSDATLQEKPVSPSKIVVIFGGALLAMAGSLALAILSAQLDDRLTSAYAVSKRLELPVLGALPQSRSFSSSVPT